MNLVELYNQVIRLEVGKIYQAKFINKHNKNEIVYARVIYTDSNEYTEDISKDIKKNAHWFRVLEEYKEVTEEFYVPVEHDFSEYYGLIMSSRRYYVYDMNTDKRII